MLVVGPAVHEVSKEFDLYWNSASAYPAAGFVGAPGPGATAGLQERFAATHADPVSLDYLKAVREAPLITELFNRRLPIGWTTAQVVYDDPAKTLDATSRTDVLLFPELMKQMGRPEKTFDIVTPYFVPGDGGSAMLTDLARSGVRVRVLTNSLAASDESVVHAGYMGRRVELLRAGVVLWELKPTANTASLEVKGRFGAGKVAGLHAKTFAVDGARVFVGSFNFDQRSARLNTEMGIVIADPVLAKQLSDFFDTSVPALAYEVRLAPDGESLLWVERSASGDEKRYDADPETDAFKRARVQFMSILPIEWLL